MDLMGRIPASDRLHQVADQDKHDAVNVARWRSPQRKHMLHAHVSLAMIVFQFHWWSFVRVFLSNFSIISRPGDTGDLGRVVCPVALFAISNGPWFWVVVIDNSVLSL